MSNQFGDALDAQDDTGDPEAEAIGSNDDALDAFLDRANTDGEKSHTVGVGITEEMHYLYRELRGSDDVDVEIPQSIRDQIDRLARRHPEVADRARRKYELDHE